jgi:hypothetical protein
VVPLTSISAARSCLESGLVCTHPTILANSRQALIDTDSLEEEAAIKPVKDEWIQARVPEASLTSSVVNASKSKTRK